MSTTHKPRPAMNINRAEVVDKNFITYIENHPGHNSDADTVWIGQNLDAKNFYQLFESQLISRNLDLMARVLRLQNKVFYTIGSSGHEGNAMVAHWLRHTDPAFLHYRSGAFMAERFRKLPDMDPIMDSALSFAASSDDPISGGRHKVWGSKPLWVLPQTSTIASHLPKAYGTALAIEHAKRIKYQLPIPDDAITVCSFGDASANHATAQTAFNAAQWAAYQGIPAPVLFVCEDNGIGISVKSPNGWIAQSFAKRPNLAYFYANGLDLSEGYAQVQAAVEHCRKTRQPTFLHLTTTRLMGHAGTDFEIEYRDMDDIIRGEALDPLLRSADLALTHNVMTKNELLAWNESIRARCFAAAEAAYQRPKLTTAAAVMQSLAPFTPKAVMQEATREAIHEKRLFAFGSEAQLPEKQAPRHLAIQINQALFDAMVKYPELALFGEDVAQKGGVYTVTKGLYKKFKGTRIFNTLLDETTILGIAQGYANMGMLPMPEIQYLAYFHNACDQIRGEACSLQFFSNNQYSNPMVMRIASLGYQKGFGGHFHNDNSVSALRDIPGIIVACPSRGDDATMMLRTLLALAKVDGRVCVFLEPISLYMTKDLYETGDGQWLFNYPEPSQAMVVGEGRIYNETAQDLLIITFGNGVPMSLRAAQTLEQQYKIQSRTLDLRWLVPLNSQQITDVARDCTAILIVDEGRRSAGVGEGVITALIEAGFGKKAIARVVGEDCYIPLGAAANTILPNEENIVEKALEILKHKATTSKKAAKRI